MQAALVFVTLIQSRWGSAYYPYFPSIPAAWVLTSFNSVRKGKYFIVEKQQILPFEIYPGFNCPRYQIAHLAWTDFPNEDWSGKDTPDRFPGRNQGIQQKKTVV